jgi:hypothetical protein
LLIDSLRVLIKEANVLAPHLPLLMSLLLLW